MSKIFRVFNFRTFWMSPKFFLTTKISRITEFYIEKDRIFDTVVQLWLLAINRDRIAVGLSLSLHPFVRYGISYRSTYTRKLIFHENYPVSIWNIYSYSAIVRTQGLTVADAVSIKKPQGRYILTSRSDRTALCTPRCYVGSDGCSISILLTYFCKVYV